MSDSDSSYPTDSDLEYGEELSSDEDSDSHKGACWNNGRLQSKTKSLGDRNHIKISVKLGDITTEAVDVIVNSVPRNLDLSVGTASGALLRQAGSMVQRECTRNNPTGIQFGQIAITGPGRLKCSSIYHGALPKYTGQAEEKVLSHLLQTCLVQADEEGHTSIAFPAFGTGFLGFPVKRVAEIMFDSIENFERQNSSSSLSNVNIVIFPSDNNTIQDFLKEQRKRDSSCEVSPPTRSTGKNPANDLSVSKFTVQKAKVGNINIDVLVGDLSESKDFLQEQRKRGSSCKVSPPTRPTGKNPANDLSVSKLTVQKAKVGNINIDVLVGDLSESEADVIVCTAPKDLQLKQEVLSASILKAAGRRLQDDCDRKYPYGINYGETIKTKGYNLECDAIYLGALPGWGSRDPLDILERLMKDCLEQASEFRYDTMAFPVLGVDSHGYPKEKVAKSMIKCLKDFERRHHYTRLRKIEIVVSDGNKNRQSIFSEFCSQLGGQNSRAVGWATRTQAPFLQKLLYSVKRGNIQINVMTGSLVKHQVDVMVITVPHDLQLDHSSALNSEVLEVAGEELQEELDEYLDDDDVEFGEIFAIGGYNLKCKKVYCGALQPWYSRTRSRDMPEDVLYKFVYDCLHKCNRSNMSSIAMSAIGTGNLKFPPDVAAEKMIRAVDEFSWKTSRSSLQEVRIVMHTGSGGDIENALKNCLSGKTKSGQTVMTSKAVNLKVPTRGTKEFLEWASKEELYPPPYWTKFKGSKSLQDWNLQHRRTHFVTEAVDAKTFTSISKAFNETIGNRNVAGSNMVPVHFTGIGPSINQMLMQGFSHHHIHDMLHMQNVHANMGTPVPSNNFQIVSIQRLENTHLYSKYALERQRLFRKAATEGHFIPLDKLKGSSGIPISTTKLDSDMAKHLYQEVNEFYFFHGTKYTLVNAIKSQGFDQRLASPGRLGSGIYGAETALKSAGYADTSPTGEYTMFLIRACLGDVHLTGSQGSFKRPPCKVCNGTLCTQHPETYDSVVADGGHFSDREFVVYDASQTYPEYIIKYK